MKKLLIPIVMFVSSIAAFAQSSVVGVIPQYAGGTVAISPAAQTPIDQQGNFSLPVPNSPPTQNVTLSPPPGTPYIPFVLAVAIAPGANNITPQIQAHFATPTGINLGFPNALSVGTNAQGFAIPGSASGGSPKVIYASQITGITQAAACTAGSSAAGTVDAAALIQAKLNGGNVDLEVDSCFALSASLALASNTTIHCTSPQFGFIMQAAANAATLINAHQNAPTTLSGTGGFLVSNIGDTNIRVNGCMLNANATEAVTGSNSHGTPHACTPSTCNSVYGVMFGAVNGLFFENNEVYDSGAVAFFASNTKNVRVANNYLHQPTPTVAFKNTDAVHFIGPDDTIYNQNNTLNCGDDCIAYNADDDNEETPAGTPAFAKWGPITNIHDDNNYLNGFFGLRLYSGTELIDNVQVSNLHGTLCGNTGLFAQNAGIGAGNIGTVRIDGWNLPTSGTCNNFGQTYNFLISSNFKTIQLAGVQIANPGINWPMITQTAGTGGILSLRDWDLNTQTSGFSNVVVTNGGTIGQIAMSGINWYDNVANSSSFLAGSVVPATVTCSNYAGPNRLLASGYVPTTENGDCFTNSYPSIAVTYVNTVFGEASAATNLAGTVPSTCTAGSGCTWALASGTDFTYQSGGGVATTTSNSAFDLINTGHTNETIRLNLATCTSSGASFCQVAFRYTDANNFVAINLKPGTGVQVFDVVGGSATQIGSTVSGTVTGNYTITATGTTVSVVNTNGTASGTTANTTGTFMGFANGGAATAMKVLSLSAKSF